MKAFDRHSLPTWFGKIPLAEVHSKVCLFDCLTSPDHPQPIDYQKLVAPPIHCRSRPRCNTILTV